MKRLSVRLRYLAGYLLVLIPILLFSLALYFSTVERSTQYINTTSLQQFTYAAENISTIVTRLESSANSALALEEILGVDEYGRRCVQSDERLCETLAAMEERLYPQAEVLFFLRGDNAIYTADGRILYHAWEARHADQLSLTMSRFYQKLMVLREPSLVPLKPADLTQSKGGLAYVAPIPAGDSLPTAMLIYLLDSSLIEEEFSNYLGSLPGDLYLYDSVYARLYTYTANDTPLMPFDNMIKIRGTGLQRVEHNGRHLVLLKTPDIQLNLNCAMVVDADIFYAELRGTQLLITALIALLILIIVILAIWTAFYNYKPIGDLVTHITGAEPPSWREPDELSLIRSAFDEQTSEHERLTNHLLELQPVVAQQLVRRLISGKITSRESFLQLTRNADAPFTRPYNAAFCIPIPKAEQHADLVLQRITRFQPARCTVCWGDLLTDNVLCMIVNFACEGEESPADASLRLAQQLSDQLSEGLPLAVRVGVGRACEDPLLLPESFAEARTAIQLAPRGSKCVFLYDPQPDRNAETSTLSETPALNLLTEGIRRGEKSVALSAFDDVMRFILNTTESFAYFRFCSAEMLTQVVHLARSLHLPVEQRRISSLIDYRSQAEFSRNVIPFIEELCTRQQENIQREDSLLNQRVLDFILDAYKRPDLSIQLVSDELDIPRAQITVLLRESVGQNFVQYVSYLRMNEFKRLLTETDKTIKDCVMEIGYCDVPNFLRKFKSIEGMTPGQYRAMNGGENTADA
ncbi:MAG: helix-turn-helix domain-containing protein [Clostridia bacterium]|nr:helix-turn-helix domain-containing protein [Clostridia bacterium]